MKARRQFVSVLLALAILVSLVTPAVAQAPVPSDRGASVGPTAPVASPVNVAPRPGRVAVEGIVLPERIAPEDAARLAGQASVRTRDFKPPAPVVGAASFAHLGDQWINTVVHLEMPALAASVSASADGAARMLPWWRRSRRASASNLRRWAPGWSTPSQRSAAALLCRCRPASPAA